MGATTRSGLLSNPLRDRFVAQFHYDFYDSNEIQQIIELNSNKLQLKVDKGAAKLASGVPGELQE